MINGESPQGHRRWGYYMGVCMLSCFSSVRLFVTLWTVAGQAPLSMGFSKQEYWSGLPFPSPEDLPNPGIEPTSPALQVDSLLLHHQGSPCKAVSSCRYFLTPARLRGDGLISSFLWPLTGGPGQGVSWELNEVVSASCSVRGEGVPNMTTVYMQGSGWHPFSDSLVAKPTEYVG